MTASASCSQPVLSQQLQLVMGYTAHTTDFGNTLRTIWRRGNPDGEVGRERNDSHVYQLMDLAWFIQQRFLPHLNLLLIFQYCLVHDKPETYAGDTPAFPDSNGIYNGPARETKDERERQATVRLKDEWEQMFPDFLSLLHNYEQHQDEESRFVYALDKLIGELNNQEDNDRSTIILGLTREQIVAYKRPRIATHPFVLQLYDEFLQKLYNL